MASCGRSWSVSCDIRGSMNLRVDLILESEQRSASPISVKSALRISYITIPLILLLVFFCSFMSNASLKRDLSKLEAEWAETEPRREESLKLISDFQVSRDIRQELNGFDNSSIEWNQHLLGLMREVPRDIQLQKLRINQSLQLVDGTPARMFNMTLNGKAIGPNAAESVMTLQERMEGSESFAGVIREAEVPEGSFQAITENGIVHQYNRVFQINCKYKARKFE